ncbi:hypothetical protein Tco_0382791 [Tanacetum coccineum]
MDVLCMRSRLSDCRTRDQCRSSYDRSKKLYDPLVRVKYSSGLSESDLGGVYRTEEENKVVRLRRRTSSSLVEKLGAFDEFIDTSLELATADVFWSLFN